MKTFTCPSCGKNFDHFRHSFPKNYRFHCAWCGERFIVVDDKKNTDPVFEVVAKTTKKKTSASKKKTSSTNKKNEKN